MYPIMISDGRQLFSHVGYINIVLLLNYNMDWEDDLTLDQNLEFKRELIKEFWIKVRLQYTIQVNLQIDLNREL